MGRGIGISLNGFNILIYDVNNEVLINSEKLIDKELTRSVAGKNI